MLRTGNFGEHLGMARAASGQPNDVGLYDLGVAEQRPDDDRVRIAEQLFEGTACGPACERLPLSERERASWYIFGDAPFERARGSEAPSRAPRP